MVERKKGLNHLYLNEKGLNFITGKPWKSALIEYLLSDDIDVITREAHEHLLNEGYEISRAAVILYLQDLLEEGYLRCWQIPGRGGMKDVYKRNLTLRKFWRAVGQKALGSFLTESGYQDLWDTVPFQR